MCDTPRPTAKVPCFASTLAGKGQPFALRPHDRLLGKLSHARLPDPPPGCDQATMLTRM